MKDVPVDGFWSISVYDSEGHFVKNPREAYSLNNVTATTDADGAVTIHFGGCDDNPGNCLPIFPGMELHGSAVPSARHSPRRHLRCVPPSPTHRIVQPASRAASGP